MRTVRSELEKALSLLDSAMKILLDLSDWQDADRTYLPAERQLDTRIDGCSARLVTA
jgi:hypothetical protein